MTIQYIQIENKKLALVDLKEASDLLEYLEDLEDSLEALTRTRKKEKRFSLDFVKKQFLENRICEMRIKAGLTQKEFAKKIKTTQAYVSKIENANYRPSLDLLEKVAKVLKMDVEALV